MAFTISMGRLSSLTHFISACVSVVRSDVLLYSHQNQQQVPAPVARVGRRLDKGYVALDRTSSFNQSTTGGCQVCPAMLVTTVHEPCSIQCSCCSSQDDCMLATLVLHHGHCQGTWSVPITPFTLKSQILFSKLNVYEKQKAFSFLLIGNTHSYLQPIFLQNFTACQICPIRAADGQPFSSPGTFLFSLPT